MKTNERHIMNNTNTTDPTVEPIWDIPIWADAGESEIDPTGTDNARELGDTGAVWSSASVTVGDCAARIDRWDSFGSYGLYQGEPSICVDFAEPGNSLITTSSAEARDAAKLLLEMADRLDAVNTRTVQS